jgi:hypothetical protein
MFAGDNPKSEFLKPTHMYFCISGELHPGPALRPSLIYCASPLNLVINDRIILKIGLKFGFNKSGS